MSQQQRAAVDALIRSAPQGFGPRPVAEMRAGFAAMMATFAVPEEVRRSAVTLGGRPAVLVEPAGAAGAGTILYFHGGSFVVGSPETAMALTASLVRRSGHRAISLDYRLAPEHPFPAAIEDGVAAYRALLDDGHEPAGIAFAGDSAGGGLSVTVALAARSAGLPVPGAIVAFSPGLDHTRSGATMVTKEGIDPFFTRADLGHTAELYLGGQDPMQELLAPALLADLAGFPPMLLQAGTNEVLLDDAVRLADRARDAGVDVILDVTADVPHVFQAFEAMLDEGGEALDRAALFVRQRFDNGRRLSAGAAPAA